MARLILSYWGVLNTESNSLTYHTLLKQFKQKLMYCCSGGNLFKFKLVRWIFLFSLPLFQPLTLSLCNALPNTLFLSPPPIVTEKDLHWLVVVVGWGGRVLLTLHGPLCSPHSCLLCCLLDVRVLPSAGGPFFLSLAHAAPAATVEVVNLAQKNILLLKSCPFIA